DGDPLSRASPRQYLFGDRSRDLVRLERRGEHGAREKKRRGHPRGQRSERSSRPSAREKDGARHPGRDEKRGGHERLREGGAKFEPRRRRNERGGGANRDDDEKHDGSSADRPPAVHRLAEKACDEQR